MRDIARLLRISALMEHARTELGHDGNVILDYADVFESDYERLMREMFESGEYGGGVVIVLHDFSESDWFGAMDRIPREEMLQMRLPLPPLEPRPAWPVPPRTDIRCLRSRSYRPSVLRRGFRGR